MSEAITIKLISGSWDGTTPIALTKDDLTVTGGRLYEGSVAAGGVIGPEILGLLSSAVPKVVSIAIDTRAPQAIAHVLPAGASPDGYREQLDLTPRFQSVLLAANDQLAITSPGRGIVTLLVNELNEHETVQVARQLNRVERTRRFRITRGDNAAWTPNPSPLALSFTYNDSSGYSETTTVGQGSVAIKGLYDNGHEGVYVWVRAMNIGAGTLEVSQVHAVSQDQSVTETNIPPVKWSKGIWVAFDDLLTFRTTSPPAGKSVILELEMSPPRNHAIG